MVRSRSISATFALLLGSLAGGCSSGADTLADAGSTGGATAGGAAGASTGGMPATGGTGAAGSGGTGGMAVGGAAGFGGGMEVCPNDSDGDNIPDDVEGAPSQDTDGDGTPDFQDTDSDDDGIPDLIEADTMRVGCNVPLDSDRDGTPNHIDTDSDDNGILDEDEALEDGSPFDAANDMLSDVDGNNLPDVYDDDNDGDTLDDATELAGGVVDTDGDGSNDHNDFDSDGDNVGDGFEGTGDADGDGDPNFRDTDSDADTVPDSCEGGAFIPGTSTPRTEFDPPQDSDSDGRFDITDVDSDNDGIKDGLEDTNGNCNVEVGETDRTLADTDNDGANDLIEQVLSTDPTCGTFQGNPSQPCTPGEAGRYWFVMPFNEVPSPDRNDVVLKTNLNKGDIAFVVDTTGTMGPAINNIKTNINTIVNELRAEVPEAHFGVLGHEDFPVDQGSSNCAPACGASDNLPARLPAGTDSYLTSDDIQVRNAILGLTTRDGADTPESQIAAMFRAINDSTLNWPGGSLAPFSPGGAFGGLGFRDDALPVLVAITDAPFHNGIEVGQTTPHDTYGFGPGLFDLDSDDLIAEMNTVGAKLVGVALNNGGAGRMSQPPYPDMAHIIDATNSLVQPSAFNSTQCLTDIGGLPVNPDGPPPSMTEPPTCRLIFAGLQNGVGVSQRVIDGVRALLRGIELEVRIQMVNDLAFSNPPAINPIEDFVESVEVYHPGQLPDPSAPTEFCETLDVQDLRDLRQFKPPVGQLYNETLGVDGENDTATSITPGLRICFRIIPKMNTLHPQTADVQFARAFVNVKARNEGQTEELDVGEPRDVFFVIPPVRQ